MKDTPSLPAEQEGKKWSGQIQSLVAIVVSIIHLSTAESGQQQPMHHVATQYSYST